MADTNKIYTVLVKNGCHPDEVAPYVPKVLCAWDHMASHASKNIPNSPLANVSAKLTREMGCWHLAIGQGDESEWYGFCDWCSDVQLGIPEGHIKIIKLLLELINQITPVTYCIFESVDLIGGFLSCSKDLQDALAGYEVDIRRKYMDVEWDPEEIFGEKGFLTSEEIQREL